ncbi:MAG TPA: patatin-like phospholipase family protein [Candidatus Polarisedimenticolaceae bacterium]|nr:patatin-like phospholipase family protein [Candidatus Polarisedimenticolaceae bacterium]
MRSRFKFRVGVALGGGAARGLAHVGVLRALARAEIPVDIVVGTSMGAIIGGAYAAIGDVGLLEQRVREVLESDEFRKNRLQFLKETRAQRGGLFFSMANLVRRGIFFGVSNLRPSFLSAEEFANSMEAMIPDEQIEELPIVFGAVALDIQSAEEIVLRTGSLRQAAAASSAIPGILPPVHMNGRKLIDGGWVDKIPVLPTYYLGADVVIAVDITADLQDAREYRRGVDIMVRANSIKDATLVDFSRRMADVVIAPEVGDVHWADFGDFDRCIQAGDDATAEVVDRLRELTRQERLLSIVRRTPGRKLAELHLKASVHQLTVE